METLGQFLKREREFRGISLKDLFRITKINASFLAKIEEDRLDELPKGAFLRGFLKSYSSAIGLDPAEVLARFQATQAASKEG